MSTLFPHHLKKLAACALSAADAHAAGLRSLDPVAAATLINGPGAPALAGDVLEIPFHDADGNRLLGLDGVEYARVRVFGESRIRYMSRPNSGEHIYIPPQLGATDRADVNYLVVTEGELKALSATVHGIPTVGISGVTMGYDPTRDKTAVSSESKPVNPVLISLAKSFGAVIIVGDSDAATKFHVRAPLAELADALRSQSGVPVALTWVPGAKSSSKSKKTTKSKDPMAQPGDEKPVAIEDAPKIGLDDWIVQLREDVTPIVRWLNKCYADEVKRLEAMQSGGYTALGFLSENKYAVWSHPKQSIETLSASTMGSLLTLSGVCGGDWIRAAFPGEKPGQVDVQRLAQQIISDCTARGKYSPRHEQGLGVWEDTDGQLVINAGSLFRTDSLPVERVQRGRVFVCADSDSLPITQDTPPATKEDARAVLEMLKSWNWSRGESDAIIALGWTGLGYVCGALNWRPHLALTGRRSTGKSTLQGAIRALLMEDRYAVAATLSMKTTAAGLRQALGSSSVPLLLDEAEPGAPAAAHAVELARIASSGDRVLQGSTDGHGVQYQVRTQVLLSAITLPKFDAADETRFMICKLEPLKTDAKRHPLTSDRFAALREMAPGLMMRVIGGWDRYRDVCNRIRARMFSDDLAQRYIDNLAAILAMAIIMLHDGDVSDEIISDMLSRIDTREDLDRQSEAHDEVNMFGHILSTAGQGVIEGKAMQMTVAEMCAVAMNQTARGEMVRALGTLGMRVNEFVPADGHKTKDGAAARGWYLLINMSADGFRKIMRASDWRGGQVAETLLRNPGAFKYEGNARIKIAKVNSAPICIPIDIEPSDRPKTLADLSIPD